MYGNRCECCGFKIFSIHLWWLNILFRLFVLENTNYYANCSSILSITYASQRLQKMMMYHKEIDNGRLR